MHVPLSARPGGAHLTYCSNIHPGETWEAIRGNLEQYVPAVKAKVSPHARFGVGLRLSAEAAATLAQPEQLSQFKTWLNERECYVFTINGFPYGPFHGTRVKEDVYLPDWSSAERLQYSNQLAHILTELLASEPGLTGSISTVPGCFRRLANERQVQAIADNLVQHCLSLWNIKQSRGIQLTLGLEPEPECLLETTQDAVEFFERYIYSSVAIGRFAGLSGLAPSDAEGALRAHLGVCLDACHAAVEFETPEQSLQALSAAGIPLAKLQVTTGLAIESAGPEQLAELQKYADETYLHQVVVQSQHEGLIRYVDLPQALQRGANPSETWRVHFHVPVFQQRLGLFNNTQEHLLRLLSAYAKTPTTSHLEVETYTFDVLPAELRADGVVSAICRELVWTRAQLQ